MKLTVVRSYNKVLEEESISILLHKNHKVYEVSGLFFRWNECKDEIKIKVLEKVEFEENTSLKDLVIKTMELSIKYNIHWFRSSFQNAIHWAVMNGAYDFESYKLYYEEEPQYTKEQLQYMDKCHNEFHKAHSANEEN